jgi:peptidyl-prolyl cis-trans isomerase C
MLECRMKVSRWLLLAAAAPVMMVGCNSFGDAMTAHTDVVARAGGQELKVEDVAQMIASNPDFPAEASMVRTLADAWIDYTLLAIAAAEDPTLAAINLEHFTSEAREQQVVWKLREQVVQVDTLFTEEELLQAWATDGPGAEIHARHILLRIPSDATPAQRDELRQKAEQIRQQAAGGADFAALAREHSEDPGSAQRGGDLGFFGRGRMVAPFEEAAFQLETGQTSPVVESPFGYHVIQVVDRRQPDITPQRDQFRQQMVQRRVQEAETAYLDSLMEASNVEIRSGGLSAVREIAQRPATVRGRAANREIASFQGGSYTSGTFVNFIRRQPAHVQSAFVTASDEQLEGVIKQLAFNQVLVREARQRGVELTAQEEQELQSNAREMINELVQGSGFAQQNGGAINGAIGTHVQGMIAAAMRGERQLAPLGPLGLALREKYAAELNEGTVARTVQRIEALRASQPAAAPAPAGGMDPHGHPGPDMQGHPHPAAPAAPAAPQGQ